MSTDYVKPSTTIARILRGLDLKQGVDFRVRGEYQTTDGILERVGTYVVVYNGEAEQTIADNADLIEERAAESGNSFRVSVYYTGAGRLWTWTANYGKRTRETAPVAETAAHGMVDTSGGYCRAFAYPGTRVRVWAADVDGVTRWHVDNANGVEVLDTPHVRDAFQEASRHAPVVEVPATAPDAAQVRPSGRVPVADAAPVAFPRPGEAAKVLRRLRQPVQPDPYEGLPQRQVGSLTWACEHPGVAWFFQNTSDSHRYTLRARGGRGWYLSGPGMDDQHVGRTFTVAALAAGDLITNQH